MFTKTIVINCQFPSSLRSRPFFYETSEPENGIGDASKEKEGFLSRTRSVILPDRGRANGATIFDDATKSERVSASR